MPAARPRRNRRRGRGEAETWGIGSRPPPRGAIVVLEQVLDRVEVVGAAGLEKIDWHRLAGDVAMDAGHLIFPLSRC
jgi:hypothetical protein